MKLKVIFPIIDLRPFISEETYKTTSPSWPYPESGEFIRNHGSIQTFMNWSDKKEISFCDAKNSISFINFHELNPNLLTTAFISYYITKRIFVINEVEAYFEICLNLKEDINKKKALTSNYLFNIITWLLDLQIEFKGVKKTLPTANCPTLQRV